MAGALAGHGGALGAAGGLRLRLLRHAAAAAGAARLPRGRRLPRCVFVPGTGMGQSTMPVLNIARLHRSNVSLLLHGTSRLTSADLGTFNKCNIVFLLFDCCRHPPHDVTSVSVASRPRDAVCAGNGGLQHDIRRHLRSRRPVRIPDRSVPHQGALSVTAGVGGYGLRGDLNRLCHDPNMLLRHRRLPAGQPAHVQA